MNKTWCQLLLAKYALLVTTIQQEYNMSFQRPVRHHNEIAKTMADVAKKALAQLSQIPAAKVADAGGDIKSGLITME